jgi:hypothetical protein
MAAGSIAAADGLPGFTRNDLIVMQSPVRHRVVVADDRVGQLVDEGVGVEAELPDGELDGGAQGVGRRCPLFVEVAFGLLDHALADPPLEPSMGAVARGHPRDTGLRVAVGAPRLGQRELAELGRTPRAPE